MLNDYHLQLLSLLVANRVRFLVIGGQARLLHHGRITRDLDLWVSWETSGERSALECSLVDWTTTHPMHTRQDMTLPLNLRPKVQIKFPEDDVQYFDAAGTIREIGPDDGVDILTSIDNVDFDTSFDRGVWIETAAGHIRYLADSDLDIVSPLGSD